MNSCKKKCEISRRSFLKFSASSLFVGSTSSFLMAIPASAEVIPDEDVLITHFVNSMGVEWDIWVDCYTASFQKTYASFVLNSMYQQKRQGILAISKALVTQIYAVSPELVPTVSELNKFACDSDAIHCYIVEAELSLHSNSAYFKDGVNHLLITTVKENGVWKIGHMCAYNDGLSSVLTRGTSWGFLKVSSMQYSTMPNVCVGMAHVGSSYEPIYDGVYESVNLIDFAKNTTQGEVGNCNYPINALKAIGLAEKMMGWYAAVGHWRDTFGVDILGGYDVAYNVNRTTSDINISVNTAVNGIQYYYIATEDKASDGSYQLFSTNCNSKDIANCQGSGILYQDGAKALAEQGKLFGDILHYYFDNSSYNSASSVGIIKIGYNAT